MKAVLGATCFLCLHIVMQHSSRGCEYCVLNIPPGVKGAGFEIKLPADFKPLVYSAYCECSNTFETLRQMAEGFAKLAAALHLDTTGVKLKQ